MKQNWIIYYEDTYLRIKYLRRVRPTRFVNNKDEALRMDRLEVAKTSEWLNFIGIKHKCEQIDF